MTLQTERLRTVEQIEAFLGGSAEVDFKPEGRDAAYGFARRTLATSGRWSEGSALSCSI